MKNAKYEFYKRYLINWDVNQETNEKHLWSNWGANYEHMRNIWINVRLWIDHWWVLLHTDCFGFFFFPLVSLCIVLTFYTYSRKWCYKYFNPLSICFNSKISTVLPLFPMLYLKKKLGFARLSWSILELNHKKYFGIESQGILK